MVQNEHETKELALDKAVELGSLLYDAAYLAFCMDRPDQGGRVLGSKICYTESMGLDTVVILNSVLSNMAIHHGKIKTVEDAEKAGKALGKVLLDEYGFDVVAVANSSNKG